MRRAAHPFGRARCGAGAGCSATEYQSLVRFPEQVKWDMGNLEVADQKAGVEWAVAQGLTDPSLPPPPAVKNSRFLS